MNLAHLHLVMNHVPTLGAVAALGLLVLAFVRRNEHLKHAGLEVLFVIAVLTLPVYVTGVAAYREMRKDISVDAVGIHHDAALIGFIVMELAGFVAWVALWQSRSRGRAARGVVPAATLLLVVALAVMGRAANLGGDIRHPEIRAAGDAAPAAGDPERFMTWAISEVAVYSTWAWPAAEVVHFLGLTLSLGVILTVNLRILGVVMRQIPFANVHNLLPWGMLGFGANLFTGMFFFVGQPNQYLSSSIFFWKVIFLVLSGANFLYLTVFGSAWRRTEGPDTGFEARFDATLAEKAIAVVSIALWFAVLYLGRMLPFLGKSF